MSYQDNVQALCDEMGVPNPIPEKYLVVDSLSFRIEDQWLDIDGTDMNRAGRLWFQYYVEWDGYIDSTSYVWGVESLTGKERVTPAFIEQAPAHFDALWSDAEEKGRTLLIAMKQANAVIVRWKV